MVTKRIYPREFNPFSNLHVNLNRVSHRTLEIYVTPSLSTAGLEMRGLAEKWSPTMCDGPAQLQQAPEGQGGHVRFTPAVRFLLHILLKLDPTCRLLPTHLLVFIHDQLIELHKHLGEKAQCQIHIIKHFNESRTFHE